MPGAIGGGAPATYSRGGNPAAYIPTAQPQADQLYQNLIAQFPQSPQATPAGALYPYALDQLQKNFLGFPGTMSSVTIPQAEAGAQQALQLGAVGGPALQQAGLGILNTGFDPQNALFNRTQQQVLDQSNVANAMAGLGGTPYGASTNANALSNFDINWQNNLLNRQTTAAGAASPLLQAAPALVQSTAGLPYSTDATIGSNALQQLGQTINQGNNQYLLPQQVLNDLQSYLQLGQSGSQLAGSLGQQGFNQTAQGLGGLISGLGGINSLTGGGITNALGLGGGGLGSYGALQSASGLSALPDYALGSIGGGADAGAALLPTAASYAAPTGGAGLFSSALSA